MSEKQIIEAINKILARGNNVQVRKKPDGSIVVFEIKKNIVTV